MEWLILAVVAPEGPNRHGLASALRNLPVRVIFEPWLPVDWASFLERLAQLNVGAVLVDYDRFEDEFAEVAARVKTIRPPAPAVVAVSARDSSVIGRRAGTAGADDVLSIPFERTLGPLLERLAAQRRTEQASVDTLGRVLGFVGAHGGCGTSTTASLLALALRRVTQRPVLLADLDASGAMIGFLTGARTPYSLLDAAANLHRLDLNYWNALVAKHAGGIDVIPAPPEPAELRGADPGRLRAVLRFLRTCYSWIVADLGEVWDGAWLDLRDDLDQLWVIATPTPAGIHQARRACAKLRTAGFEPRQWRLLMNHAGRPAVTGDEIESLVGKRPDAWLPEDGELRAGADSDALVGLRGKAAGRMLRLAIRLAGVSGPSATAAPTVRALKILRREGLPRLLPRL